MNLLPPSGLSELIFFISLFIRGHLKLYTPRLLQRPLLPWLRSFSLWSQPHLQWTTENRKESASSSKLLLLPPLRLSGCLWHPHLCQRLETRPWRPSAGPCPQIPAGSWASQPRSPSCPAVATKAAACRGRPTPTHTADFGLGLRHGGALCALLAWLRVVSQSYPTALTDSGPMGSGGAVSCRKRQLRRSRWTSRDSGGSDRRAWITRRRNKETSPGPRALIYFVLFQNLCRGWHILVFFQILIDETLHIWLPKVEKAKQLLLNSK